MADNYKPRLKGAPTRNGREPGQAGPPTKERRRYNRLTDLLKASVDIRLDAFEDLNKEYPDLIRCLMAACQGRTTYTTVAGTIANVPEVATLKYTIALHGDLYKELGDALEWAEKRLSEGKSSVVSEGDEKQAAVFQLHP